MEETRGPLKRAPVSFWLPCELSRIKSELPEAFSFPGNKDGGSGSAPVTVNPILGLHQDRKDLMLPFHIAVRDGVYVAVAGLIGRGHCRFDERYLHPEIGDQGVRAPCNRYFPRKTRSQAIIILMFILSRCVGIALEILSSTR